MPALQTIIRYINNVPLVAIEIRTTEGNEAMVALSQKGGLNGNAIGYMIIVARKYNRTYGRPITSGWFQSVGRFSLNDAKYPNQTNSSI